MIKRPKPERFRLRRTMMFMNAQKPGLIKDAYIYGCDSIMLDLEDAVAENQKDAARFSLYHALTTIDYGSTEVIVRINGLDTPHWQEDIRVCVAGGADGIRIAKCESAQDVKIVEEHVEKAEREFGVEVGRTLLMAALESPKGILNAYEICSASDRMFGVAISGGDFRKCMQTKFQKDGIDMLVARGQMLMAARAAGVDVDGIADTTQVVESPDDTPDDRPLLSFTLSDRAAADALPERLTTEQYVTVTTLLDKLRQCEEFDGMERYLAKLSAAKREIAAIQAEIDSINAEVREKLYPFDGITLKDRKTVNGIVARYNALSEYDRTQIERWEDVVKTKTKLDNILRGIVIGVALSVIAAVVAVFLVRRIRRRRHRKEREMEELAARYRDER